MSMYKYDTCMYISISRSISQKARVTERIFHFTWIHVIPSRECPFCSISQKARGTEWNPSLVVIEVLSFSKNISMFSWRMKNYLISVNLNDVLSKLFFWTKAIQYSTHTRVLYGYICRRVIVDGLMTAPSLALAGGVGKQMESEILN